MINPAPRPSAARDFDTEDIFDRKRFCQDVEMVHALVHTIQRNLNIAFLATFYILHPATDLSNLSRSPHPHIPDDGAQI